MSNQIQTLVSQNSLMEALNLLDKYADDYNRKDISLLISQLNAINKDENVGLIDSSDARRVRMRISQGILFFAERIKIPETVVNTFSIGSHCLVVSNHYGHMFEIGEEVVIIDHAGIYYKVTNGFYNGWLDVCELSYVNKNR